MRLLKVFIVYTELDSLADRPAPFADADAAQLWTDPHVSNAMLEYHLDDAHGLASRPKAQIAEICRNLNRRLPLAGAHVLDLGCGPGLYAGHYLAFGAQVTGIDFSPASVAYARAALPDAEIHQANYVDCDLGEGRFDLICLVYGDVCALSPDQRHHLFGKVHAALKPKGRFVLDAFPVTQFEDVIEELTLARNLMDGFWSAQPYVGIKQVLTYPHLALRLDRYLIADPCSVRIVSNWLQYLYPEQLKAELVQAGFEHTVDILDDTLADDWRETKAPFFMIAVPR